MRPLRAFVSGGVMFRRGTRWILSAAVALVPFVMYAAPQPALSEQSSVRVEGPVLSEQSSARVEGPVLSEQSSVRVEGPVLSEQSSARVEGPVLSEQSSARVEGKSSARAKTAQTALDRYVAAPDSSFTWKAVRDLPAEGVTATLLEMTSQKWLTEQEVERPLWTHWLTVIRPAQVT